MSQYKSEIILGDDGFFRKRETRESVIQSAEHAILDCITEPTLTINPIQTYGELSIPVLDNDSTDIIYNTFYGYQNREPYTTVNAFVYLPAGFPLPKTDVLKNSTLTQYAGEDVYSLCPRRQDGIRSQDDAVRPNNLITFKPPTHKTYVLIKNIPICTQRQMIGPFNQSVKAYLFGIEEETGVAVTYDIPNIYDTGQICTGNDAFRPSSCDVMSLTAQNLNVCVSELIFNLHTTQINNDLRSWHHEENFVVFKKDEVGFRSQNKQEQEYLHQAINEIPDKRAYNSFYRNMSQEYVNQFALWLQSQKD